VIPVHLYGRPSALPDLGVAVVEDAAQGHGAVDPASTSAAVAYSFYPTKNLGGVGDGGAVTTDDASLAAELRLRRTHGVGPDYEHSVVSGNSRMSEIEAAMLRVALARLDVQNARRREIAARYREAAPALRWQEPHERHVYHLCVVRVDDRDSFRASLPFDTGVHYPRALTQQPAYRVYARHRCPEAEAWAAECVSLPCFPEMTDDEIEAVCRALQ
jgi:dTDP-3-amino-3,4,6-trideoxy-alpha-D-glucose transaminase